MTQRLSRRSSALHHTWPAGTSRDMSLWRRWASVPGLLLMVPVIAMLDLCLALYQWQSFGVLGIARVPRADFIVIDRHRIRSLGVVEKIGCVYCGYVNGVLAHARMVAATTERFWCPVRHARTPRDLHALYGQFADFPDTDHPDANWRDDPWERGFASGGMSGWPGAWSASWSASF